MKLNENDVVILRTIAHLYGAPMVSEIHASLPPNLFANKKSLSARLCEMRSRGLLESRTLDAGTNEWILTVAGGEALLTANQGGEPDSGGAPNPDVSESIQVDSPDISADISPDIPDDSETIADTIATALEEFNALGTPVCADLDAPPQWPDVSEDLLEEASSLFLSTEFPRLHDALYVLHTLAEFLKDRPAMTYELERIAAYLVEETP